MIVVAEDDAAIRELVTHHLEAEGYSVLEASDGFAALRLARGSADLLVLDIGLPGIDGFEVARTLRRERRPIPILMLTARSDEVDRVLGLELGSDDYVCKPFSPRELVARVKAMLRRTIGDARLCVRRFGRIEVDEAAREARVDGRVLELKPREFELLTELVVNAGIALSREWLIERVWGADYPGDQRTIDVHVQRLRYALERPYGLAHVLETVRGYGYRFARS